MSTRIVICFGSSASGMAHNADKLLKHFGCTRVVEEWNGTTELHDGDLALTHLTLGDLEHAPIVRQGLPDGTRIAPAEPVLRQLGCQS